MYNVVEYLDVVLPHTFSLLLDTVLHKKQNGVGVVVDDDDDDDIMIPVKLSV